MGSKRKSPSGKNMPVHLDDISAGVVTSAELIRSADLAAKLGVSERSLRNWRKKGSNGARLRRVKLLGEVYYDRRSVENFIATQQAAS